MATFLEKQSGEGFYIKICIIFIASCITITLLLFQKFIISPYKNFFRKFLFIKKSLNPKHEIRNSKQFQNYKFKCSKPRFQFLSFDIRICFGFRYLNFEFVKKTQTAVFVIHSQVTRFVCSFTALGYIWVFSCLLTYYHFTLIFESFKEI